MAPALISLQIKKVCFAEVYVHYINSNALQSERDVVIHIILYSMYILYSVYVCNVYIYNMLPKLYSMYVHAYTSCATYHTLSMPSICQAINTTWCSIRALTVRRHCDVCMQYRSAVLSQPFFIICISDARPITVSMVQSRSVVFTINGSGEVYSCTLSKQTVDITSGQTVQQTGLTPSTNYTVNCRSVNDSCLEATTRFTTSMAHLP